MRCHPACRRLFAEIGAPFPGGVAGHTARAKARFAFGRISGSWNRIDPVSGPHPAYRAPRHDVPRGSAPPAECCGRGIPPACFPETLWQEGPDSGAPRPRVPVSCFPDPRPDNGCGASLPRFRATLPERGWFSSPGSIRRSSTPLPKARGSRSNFHSIPLKDPVGTDARHPEEEGRPYRHRQLSSLIPVSPANLFPV